jgi:toluene monooxygenase electron transfer component
MSNLANEDGVWQFIIRRTPSGRGSGVLFGLEEGAEISIDGPYGHAYFRADSERETVCIAGGSGLAPMLGIARAALRVQAPRPVHFFDGARTSADLCGGGLLDEAASLTYLPVLSTPGEDWSGATGFVHEAVGRHLTGKLDAYEYYFAGPPPMIEAVQALLMVQHGVPYTQIHFDRFV